MNRMTVAKATFERQRLNWGPPLFQIASYEEERSNKFSALKESNLEPTTSPIAIEKTNAQQKSPTSNLPYE